MIGIGGIMFLVTNCPARTPKPERPKTNTNKNQHSVCQKSISGHSVESEARIKKYPMGNGVHMDVLLAAVLLVPPVIHI